MGTLSVPARIKSTTLSVRPPRWLSCSISW